MRPKLYSLGYGACKMQGVRRSGIEEGGEVPTLRGSGKEAN